MSKVSTLVDCTDEDAIICLDDFVASLQNELSVNCAIPFNISAEAIAQLVKNARTMFYKMYEDATEEMFITLPASEIQKHEFRSGMGKVSKEYDKDAIKSRRGTFGLPEGVVSVVGVYEIGGFSGEAGWNTGLLGKTSGDISLNRMVYQSVYDRTMAVSADNMMYYICTEAFLDQSRQLFQNMISFRYNRLTNNLRFLGELPRRDVILDVLVRVPDCDLYNDELFRRYVLADCKCQLGRILNSFTFQLPGDVSINSDAIANEGTEEKERIIQELKDMSGSWYMLTT